MAFTAGGEKLSKIWNGSGVIRKYSTEGDTCEVTGVITDPSIDQDGETITAECAHSALTAWFDSGFTPVRLNHGSQPVGRALDWHPEGEASILRALIVEPTAVKLIRTGCVTAWSIAGRVIERDPVRPLTIRKMRVIECSICDSPSNRSAIFTAVKSEVLAKDAAERALAMLREDAQALAFARHLEKAAANGASDGMDMANGCRPSGEGAGRGGVDAASARLFRPSREGDASDGMRHSDIAVCDRCGTALASRCPKCQADCPACARLHERHHGEDSAEKAEVVAGLNRANARLRKALESNESQRHAMARALEAVRSERDAALRELKRRPYGALRAVPVDKRRDVGVSGEEPSAEEAPLTPGDAALAAIRRVHKGQGR